MHQIIHVLCLFVNIGKKLCLLHIWRKLYFSENMFCRRPGEFHENLLYKIFIGETISCYCLPTHFPFSNLTEGSSAVRSQSFRQHVRKVAILHCPATIPHRFDCFFHVEILSGSVIENLTLHEEIRSFPTMYNTWECS